jgi:hypothetical protein
VTEKELSGSLTWFVEDVDLYSTRLRYAVTNEVCTIANGSLASTRIINGAWSPKAVVYLHLKFAVEVPYAKIQLFQKTIEAFVKARPRQWLSLIGFRANRMEAELGYIEYLIVLQHREPWQNMMIIWSSQADLYSYCLEVQKKLGMNFKAPPLPVDLTLQSRNPDQGEAPTATGSEGPTSPGGSREIGHRSVSSSVANRTMREISAMFGGAPAPSQFQRPSFV